MAAPRSPRFVAAVLIVAALFLSSTFVLFNEAARPVKDDRKMDDHYSADMEAIQQVLNGLAIQAIKAGGGPSAGGKGHMAATSALTLEGIKKSGPSPGQGN